jgi:hypothetical protein
MLETELLITLTGLRRKRRLRYNRRASKRFSDRAVTRHYRHVIDICLRIADEAEAVRQLISL